MNILVILHALNGLLMIAMPISLAIFLTRRWKMGWGVWWIGFATFIISQVGHIPFNWGAGLLLNQSDLVYWSLLAQQVFNAAFLGLSAGIFEEVSRYLVLRFWAKKARSWQNGALFGVGHGGSEAIILGVLVLLTYTSMLAIRGTDLSTLVPSDQLELAQQQVQAYWSIPWYDSLLGAVERFFAIPVQISLGVIVMQTFIRKKIRWLFLAILYHAVVDGTVVFLMPTLGRYWTEALVGGFALLSLAIIFLLRQPEPALIPEPVSAPTSTMTIKPVEETPENLDNSRYQG
ncbi:MAG: YhfC family glutamic-type intramembrane protease [Chloroflexota bacterium]